MSGPRDARQILNLPIFGFGERAVTAFCKGCGKELTIKIPVMPRVRCSQYDEGQALMVQDLDGAVWVPIETDEGWFRRRLL